MSEPSKDKSGNKPEPSRELMSYEALRAQRHMEIEVHTSEKDKHPVPVTINGYSFVIKRGVRAIVPESVVKVLQDAVRTEYDPPPKLGEQPIPRNVLSYPFMVTRQEVPKEELEKIWAEKGRKFMKEKP